MSENTTSIERPQFQKNDSGVSKPSRVNRGLRPHKDAYSNALYGADDDDPDDCANEDTAGDDACEQPNFHRNFDNSSVHKPEYIRDSSFITGYRARLRQRQKWVEEHSLPGVATGFPRLDAATGGLRGLSILAGETGKGRTSLALQICLQAMLANPKVGVVYYILDDMSRDDVFDQLLCQAAKVDLSQLETSNPSTDVKKRVRDADERLSTHIRNRMQTCDLPELEASLRDDCGCLSEGMTWLKMWKDCNELRNAAGLNKVLCVVDMFQNMPVPIFGPENERSEPRNPDQLRLNELVRYRRRTEKDCPGGWPLLVVYQVRKEVRKREHGFHWDDLKGLSDAKYKAKRILFLEPNDTEASPKGIVRTNLQLAKVRHGHVGIVPFQFHYDQFWFEEIGLPETRTKNPGNNDALSSDLGAAL